MSAKSYLNFDLLLNQIGDSYQAHVIDSPAGQASQMFTLPLSALELENFILRIGQNRGNVRSLHLTAVDVPSVKKLGAALYDSIFSGAVVERFRSSLALARHEGKGLRIRLRLSGAPALTDIPWELMFDEANNNYIGLSVNTPIIRQLDLATQPEMRQAAGVLQVLVMIASPSNYPPLDVEREWERINSATQGLQAQGRLVLTRVEPSLAALQQQLRKGEYHVFHYIGHGGFDRSSNDGVLVLEDEQKKGHPVSGQYLGAILYDQATIQLALLNSCSGGRTSVTDPFAGVGQSLLQKGIPAVIAMQFEITDEAAITFSHEFYAALADGYPVDAAVAEARKMIYAKANQLEWATPVLYMSTDNGGILHEPKPGEAPAREAPPPAPQAETQAVKKAKPAPPSKPSTVAWIAGIAAQSASLLGQAVKTAVVGVLLKRFGWKGVAVAGAVLACAIAWLMWQPNGDVTPATDEAVTTPPANTAPQPAIQANDSAATTQVSATPSTDIDNPTPLLTNELKDVGIGETASYYYTFYAGPGEVKITVDAKNQCCANPALEVIVMDIDANRLFQIKMNNSQVGYRLVNRVQINKQQPVLMRLLLTKELTDYRIRFEGAIDIGSTKIPKDVAQQSITAAVASYSNEQGEKVYKGLCFSCHDMGVAGAPKLGDKADWGPRIATGNDELYKSAIEGRMNVTPGKVMPAKGGNPALSEEEIKSAVDWMVNKSQ